MTDTGELSEATRRVIDAALAYQEHFGESMHPIQIRQLAHDNPGASYHAALILVLGQGLDRNGETHWLATRYTLRPGGSPGIYVGNKETRAALLQYGLGRIRAPLVGRYAPRSA